jgi:hypothetical protein
MCTNSVTIIGRVGADSKSRHVATHMAAFLSFGPVALWYTYIIMEKDFDSEPSKIGVQTQFELLTEKKEESNKEGALLLERLKMRTPESIESFDVNEEGLAIHGSNLSNLEGILINGFDNSSKLGTQDEPLPIHTWYNVIGHPASDSGRQTKIGFGLENRKFGGEIIFVTDIFKKLWPNLIMGIVKLPPAITGNNGIFGEIEINHSDRSGERYDPRKCRINLWAKIVMT